MKQYRGCSRLVYAIETEGENGAVTFGDVKELAPVKAVSREISSDSEDVWADNTLQQKTYGGTSITRSFDTTRIAPEVVAELLGDTIITIGTKKAFATRPDGSKRPFIAIGYALHDGDADKPCEVVWAYHCTVDSITKASNTIDTGTGSEGQTVTITNNAPKNAFTKTGEKNLDFTLPISDVADVDKFFAQVVTPDNASTIFTA